MKFQKIDFYIELFRAYLEPPGTQIEYLEMLRKESKYNRDTFIIKLKNAFDNIQKAYQMEVDFKRRFIPDIDEKTNLSFSINVFRKHDILIPLANEFVNGHAINRTKLEDLSFLINSLGVYYSLKKIGKSISKLELKKKDEAQNIENKFNQMPIEEVRSHFLPLIQKKNRKGIIWMSASDFDIFIKRSFGMQTDLSPPKINLVYGAKYAIVKLFYGFYEKCQNDDLTQNRKKDPFIELLKNAFDTKVFDDLINSNFKTRHSKSYEWD
jgi:hypothetical protein